MLTLDKVRAAARSPWAIPLAVVVVALLLFWRLEVGRRAALRAASAEAELRRVAEERVLHAEGYLTAERVRAKELERRAAEVEKRLGLAEEAARLAKLKARPVAVVDMRTGPVEAGPSPQAGAPAAQSHTSETEAADGAGAPSCLLRQGDLGEVRAGGVVYETRAGNVVPVLTAEAWRLKPEPATRLFGGELALGELQLPERPPLESPGFGLGGYGGCSRGGCGVGLGGSLPPARWWVFQLELAGGVAFVGEPQGSVLLLGRLRR